jgi:predicted adenylyl cyclase CyaB
MNIEVEVRSFITEEEYSKLLEHFKSNSDGHQEDYQETFYFNCPQDLRIQKNDHYAKVWLKKGELHDDHREEIEVRFDRADFGKMEEIFLALGLQVEIKWFRQRHEFKAGDFAVCLDHTKGYGYIIELEKMCTEAEQEREFERLKAELANLGVALTPKEEFKEKYEHYRQNWQALTN